MHTQVLTESLETGPEACSIHTTVTKIMGRENGCYWAQQ